MARGPFCENGAGFKVRKIVDLRERPISMSTFDSTKRSLPNVLGDIVKGKIQLPDFQRGWVWDDDHIRSLPVSITRSFPVRAVMLLETDGQAHFQLRPVEGHSRCTRDSIFRHQPSKSRVQKPFCSHSVCHYSGQLSHSRCQIITACPALVSMPRLRPKSLISIGS